MSLLDAIDKLLEPITTKIFSTSFGKSIKPLSNEELFAETDLNNDPNCASLPGNIFHPWMEE